MHFSPTQPEHCPACNSERIRKILYGYPSAEAMDASMNDQLILGGCEIGGFDPSWQCLDCHTSIYRENLRWGNDSSRGTH